MKPTYLTQESNIYIPIKKNTQSMLNVASPKGEYSLKQHFFDPTKGSPPNNFITKLQKRMSVYNTSSYSNMNDDKRDSE